MCGRFSLTAPADVVAEEFGLDAVPELAPRYNIAPTQPIPVVRLAADGRRELASLRWGFPPAPGQRTSKVLINARGETAAVRPPFRDAFARGRCLVPADAFYEWRAIPGLKARQPYAIRMRDGRPFALAGLWLPVPAGEAGAPGVVTLLTTAPNETLRPIHDRMPLILPRARYADWLDVTRRPEPGIVAPFPDGSLVTYPVGPQVNDARNDVPACLAPLRA